MGQLALWFGKSIFLFFTVALPLLFVMSFDWRGFGLDAAQWAAMSGAVILAVALLCALTGGVTALAASSRQVIALAVLAVVGAGVWLAIPKPWLAIPAQITRETIYEQRCGTLVAGLLGFSGLTIGWWFATVPRRRYLSGAILLITLIASNWIAETWNQEWMSQPAKEYANASRLSVSPGPFDPDAENSGRRLWPTLSIAGLGKDEVATILEFAPILEGDSWPPEGSHSDVPSTERGYSSWLHHEHTRALLKHYPPTTLWEGDTNNDAMYNGRSPLNEVLQRLRLKREEAIKRSWRLQLIVHEMKCVVRVPYRHLWTQENEFLIRPGMRLELDAFAWIHDAWEMHGRVHRVSSAVLPVDSFRTPFIRGRSLDDDFFLLLEDREFRQNAVHSLGLTVRRPDKASWADPSRLWINDETQGFEVRLWHPPVQRLILERPLDEWIDQQDASLWHAEERGTIEFELTPEQMAQVFPEPKPKERNKS